MNIQKNIRTKVGMVESPMVILCGQKQESFAFLYSQSEPNNSLLSHFQFSQNRTDVFVTAQLDEEKKK